MIEGDIYVLVSGGDASSLKSSSTEQEKREDGKEVKKGGSVEAKRRDELLLPPFLLLLSHSFLRSFGTQLDGEMISKGEKLHSSVIKLKMASLRVHLSLQAGRKVELEPSFLPFHRPTFLPPSRNQKTMLRW